VARLFLSGWEDERRIPKRGRRWGSVVVYKTERWGWIARRVPRPSGRSRAVARLWADWLRLINVLWKYTHPLYREALAETERLSGIPARDWFTSALNGLLFVIETDDGRRLYSMSHRERFSRSLDVFGQSPGSLLFRGVDVWECLPPGNAGDVLTVGASGLPVWMPGGGGGASFFFPHRHLFGQWGYEVEVLNKVTYREFRDGRQEWASCVVPALGALRVEVGSLMWTRSAGGGQAKFRIGVWGSGPGMGISLLGEEVCLVDVPSRTNVIFPVVGGVNLPSEASDASMLIVEFRRLGNETEDTHTDTLGFFGMQVWVL